MWFLPVTAYIAGMAYVKTVFLIYDLCYTYKALAMIKAKIYNYNGN